AHGLRDVTYLRAPAVSFPYFDSDGGDPAIRFRIALDGHDRFRWRTGSKPRLYGLHRLADARRAGYVVLAEGESDTPTLLFSGFPAVGLAGAGNWSEQRDAAVVRWLCNDLRNPRTGPGRRCRDEMVKAIDDRPSGACSASAGREGPECAVYR